MNKKVALLVTVGTSILSNASNREEVPREFRDVLKKVPKMRPDDPNQVVFREAYLSQNENYRVIYDLLCRDPRTMSAELNVIIGFLDTWPLRKYITELRIYLYPTDTDSCRFCAYLIRRFLEEKLRSFVPLSDDCKVTVEMVELKGFGASPEFFSFSGEGLKDLLDKYAKNILELKEKGYRIIIMPVGGYKPECTYATIIGLMFGASKVVYIHESFKEVIDLPLLPIDVDPRFIQVASKIGDDELPRSVIEMLGVDVDELLDRGILEKGGEGYRLAEWVKSLLRAKGLL
ncbi:MAG: putative CRISPR-associated protein [Crenarchaeota archaeon]|nr:putative CRISPR-associated protein [Thermoproteota archaeon]